MGLQRRLLLGTALALPAVISTRTASAAAPQATEQAPGFYRFKVGDSQVTVVNDGINRVPEAGLANFVRNAPVADVRTALSRQFLPADRLDITFNITFLNTGRQLILFDTGTGGQLAATAGTMWANMRAAGIDPAAVDLIVLTHFHGDHVSGLTDREGRARFPNAEIVVPETEWAFWMGDRAPAQAATMVKSRFAPYPQEKIRRVVSTAEVAPGVRAMPTFGHTPGHTSYLVSSGSATLLVLGDVTNHPAINLRNPGWHIGFDMDGPVAETTRRRVFDQAAADRTPIVGYHWPFPALGHVAKAGDGYELVPAGWTSLL